MLVKLKHGMCVNPEVVKLFHVRIDRNQRNEPSYSVIMKTDDDGFIVLNAFDNHEDAVALSRDCARRINAASAD